MGKICFPFHNWSEWKDLRRFDITRGTGKDDRRHVGFAVEQERRCENCKKVEIQVHEACMT